jgi:hypothetical protein
MLLEARARPLSDVLNVRVPCVQQHERGESVGVPRREVHPDGGTPRPPDVVEALELELICDGDDAIGQARKPVVLEDAERSRFPHARRGRRGNAEPSLGPRRARLVQLKRAEGVQPVPQEERPTVERSPLSCARQESASADSCRADNP